MAKGKARMVTVTVQFPGLELDLDSVEHAASEFIEEVRNSVAAKIESLACGPFKDSWMENGNSYTRSDTVEVEVDEFRVTEAEWDVMLEVTNRYTIRTAGINEEAATEHAISLFRNNPYEPDDEPDISVADVEEA